MKNKKKHINILKVTELFPLDEIIPFSRYDPLFIKEICDSRKGFGLRIYFVEKKEAD